MQAKTSASAAVLLALSLAVATPSAAKTFGIVIGIDHYAHVPGLEGAVNDARDVADALSGKGAEVTLLLDAEATRANIIESFRRVTAQSRPGDVIVFSYAGHGIQQPEILPGDEADGMDEVFVLHGFWTDGPGASERLRDNDIAELFAEVPSEVLVLFVADSCHSGTMTRAPDPRGKLGRSRFVDVGPITNDPLGPPSARSFQLEAGDMPNVVFAAAARDDQETPEVVIDGQARGALSWSIAQALRGAADGGDGVTTLPELRTYVRSQVRAWSEARQTPDVVYSRALVSEQPPPPVLVLADLLAPRPGDGPSPAAGAGSGAAVPSGAADPLAAAQVFSLETASSELLQLAPPPALFVRDAPGAPAPAGLSDVAQIAGSEASASLLWDRQAGQLVDRINADPVAEIRDIAGLRAAIVKWRAVRGLTRWIGGRPLSVELDDGDERYRLGEEVWVRVHRPAPEFRYVTLVNLASTGEVQFVFPSAGHVRRGADLIGDSEQSFRLGPAPVVPPTGADHLVAVVSRGRLDALHAAVERIDGQRKPDELLALLARHAGRAPEARVGYVPILTER